MQYAIIQTGGKQYKAEIGKSIEVELLSAKDTVTFDQVLLVVDGDNVEVGTPFVKDTTVVAKVIASELKGKKIDILRYKSKSRYRKHTGHRQKYTKVMIESIGNLKAEQKATPKSSAQKNSTKKSTQKPKTIAKTK